MTKWRHHIVLFAACAGLAAGCGGATEAPMARVGTPAVGADPRADVITLPTIKAGRAAPGQSPRQKVTPITLPPIKS